ncbi:MAG: DMT family transporter [Clostridia bacterium]|nr:DMT family transporter [Clostridia bacterium]
MKNRGRIYMVAAALLWGLAGVCVKSVDWTAMQQVAARSVLAFFVICAFHGGLKIKFTRAGVVGAFMMSVTSILYLEAIKLTTAGTAIVLQYVAPIFILLYWVIIQRRKPKAYEIIITFLVFGGCVLSFLGDMSGGHVLGNLLGLLSGVTFAANIIILGNMDGEKGDPFDALKISCIMSFVFSLPFSIAEGLPAFTLKNVFWIIVLGVFQYGLANVFFAKGINSVGSLEGSLILTLEPVFNPIPVAIFCGEMMSPLAILGAVIVIAGVTAHTLLSVDKGRSDKV